LLEKHELKFRNFGDQTMKVLVKDTKTIEVIRDHEDGNWEFKETIHPTAALKL
jgi:hypothetical protein